MRLPIPAFAAVAVALTATPADAAIMLATWTTTISDVGGHRVASGPDLVGTPFELRLKYDTTLGEVFNETTPRAVSRTLFSDRTQPLLEASITFGGETYAVDFGVKDVEWSLQQAQTVAEPLASLASTRLRSLVKGPAGSAFLTLEMSAEDELGGLTPDLTRPFSVAYVGKGVASLRPDGVAPVELNLTSPAGRKGRLTVVEPPATAVPEPATWALLILGFGVTGAVLRGRPLAEVHIS